MARIPNDERPTQNDCSNAALPQISSGFRRRVRMVEKALRGFSERGGNGGTKRREAFAARDIGKRLSKSGGTGGSTPRRRAAIGRGRGLFVVTPLERSPLAHRRSERAV